MSYNLLNTNPLQLSASIDSSGTIDMAYSGIDLTSYNEEVLIELDVNQQTQICVSDFTHGGQDRDVYVFEVDSSGGLTGPWTRSGAVAVSGVMTYASAPKDVEMAVMSVLAESSAPSPETKSEAQQSGAGIIKVKIRRRGELPIPSRRG
ncbi:hypothetical protein OV203_21420 [Nannocystis sp. ILAH1]|uniref:hypothetical protein n=1 Tax=Nannocystis sp. ILAH1 TaxID=2996789 RepID=UPI00226F8150|nr:hypothetical protein [Nannocystis sp. ILAH1]MCY0989712.1 hypothetical protein [Nannocystis sp. ILAH1]